MVAGNGLFLHKDNGTVSGFVKVGQIGFLDDLKIDQSIRYKHPKIPADLVYKVWQFFKRVVAKYDAESCVVLFLDEETGKFYAVVPEQVVTKAGVRYIRPAISHFVPWTQIGTIHSHCDFDAFHSGTDVHDEATFDGLHVTFGHNDQAIISVSASIVLNGLRNKIDPLTVLDGLEHVDGEFFKPTASEDLGQQIEQALEQVNRATARPLGDETLIFFEGNNGN